MVGFSIRSDSTGVKLEVTKKKKEFGMDQDVKVMGKLGQLVIHCTATQADMKITKELIHKWHFEERGWDRFGYSDLINQDGSITNLTPFNTDDEVDYNEMTWGVKGENSVSRHIVYAGGIDKYGEPKDTRTPEQMRTLEYYVKYHIIRYPHIKIAGHNQFANKACPSFDVPKWLRMIGIKEQNIYKGE